MTDRASAGRGRRRPDYFDDSDVSGDMGGSIVRGSAFLGGASVARFGMNLVSTVILARLLNPEDYGLLAMVFVVTNFLTLFRDMNLSLATVQRRTISHAQVSTVFWFNLAVSGLIAGAVMAVSPGIAWFYDEPRLTAIAILLALPIFVRGLVGQHKALLRRKLYFGTLTGIDLSAALMGYIAAIAMAWQGYGYWSLVGMHIASASFDVVLAWWITGWRPGLPRRGVGVRSMVVFGSNLTAYSVIRFSSRSLDNLLIGSQMGAALLGVYSKSRDLAGQMVGYAQAPFSAVGVPSLSRLTEEPENYRRTFHRLAEKIALISVAGAVPIGCTANEVVYILLGEKWLAAGPILAILSVGIVTEAVFGCVNWLFISQGRGGQMLKYGMYDAVVRIVAVVIGLQWGVLGVASGLVLSAVFFHLPAQIWYACREGPVRQRHVYAMLAPILLGGITAALAILAMQRLVPIENPIGTIAMSGGVFLVVEGTVLLITPSGRQTLRDLRRGAEILLRRRKAAKP
jgi:PST family polysaccharide transporter